MAGAYGKTVGGSTLNERGFILLQVKDEIGFSLYWMVKANIWD